MRILSLLPLFFRKNMISVLIMCAVIAVISFSALMILTQRQALEKFIEGCDPRVINIKSQSWNSYQRTEILGIAKQLPEIESAFEIKRLAWKDKIPEVWGVSNEFLKQNSSYLGLDADIISGFSSNPKAALISEHLFNKLSLKMHDQLVISGLYVDVKGVFAPDAMIDENKIFVNDMTINHFLRANSGVNSEIIISMRFVKNPNLEQFKRKLSGIMLSSPQDLEITRLQDDVELKLHEDRSRVSIMFRFIWFSLLLFSVFVYVLQKHEINKLTNDIATIYEIGMTKSDFMKLAWGYAFYPTILSAIAGFGLFVLVYNDNWLSFNSYYMHAALQFHTFLSWFAFLVSMFICWWIVLYLTFISKTTASSLEDHAKYLRSFIYPDKIIARSQNTIKRAKSALIKLIQKEQD